MTATAAPLARTGWSWRPWRRPPSMVLVVETANLLADLVANTGGRWGGVSWSRYGNVSTAHRGKLRVEVHHSDGSVFCPAWRLKVYADTGSLLADVDPSSRGVWGSTIPAQMSALLGRIAT